MTFSFHEQMRFIRQDYNNKIINSVFPHETWTIQDYIDFHLCISNGYLVQECGSNFKIGFTDDFTEDITDDFYRQHFKQHLGIEETNDDCVTCGEVGDDGVNASTTTKKLILRKKKEVEVEDKTDYFVVYGEYDEIGIDPIWGAERFKDSKEALKEFNLKQTYDYDVVYMDSMTWDEEADEWDQENVDFWSSKQRSGDSCSSGD